MKKIICEVCGKRIKSNEQVSAFNDGGAFVYTHVSSDKYACDYTYMIESMTPTFYSCPNDVKDED